MRGKIIQNRCAEEQLQHLVLTVHEQGGDNAECWDESSTKVTGRKKTKTLFRYPPDIYFTWTVVVVTTALALVGESESCCACEVKILAASNVDVKSIKTKHEFGIFTGKPVKKQAF